MIRKMLFGAMICVLSASILSAQAIITATETIMVEGDGMVAMNGSGMVTVTGEGLLFIVDRTGDSEIVVDSHRRTRHNEREARGNIVHIYRRFDGTAVVSGDDIAVVAEGINIQMTVSGTGVMLLDGVGEYSQNEQTVDWSTDGITISLGVESP